MAEIGFVEHVLRRERWIALGALGLVVFLSWLYIIAGAGMGMMAAHMSSLEAALGLGLSGDGATGQTMTAIATPASWSAGYALLMVAMWWVMMIAMMLPSAAPTILLHAMVERRARGATASGGTLGATVAFTTGYLLIWGVFSIIAAGLQWAFLAAGWLAPGMLNATSAAFAAGVLIAAGVYQLTGAKRACLAHCRGPIHYLTRHWRRGASGAFIMGLHHGTYCLGCCWALMGVLFFGGIMNLYWIVGLACIVLLEKLAGSGPRLAGAIGVVLVIWGGWFLANVAMRGPIL